jgi:hypothetical protein
MPLSSNARQNAPHNKPSLNLAINCGAWVRRISKVLAKDKGIDVAEINLASKSAKNYVNTAETVRNVILVEFDLASYQAKPVAQLRTIA